MLFASTVLAFTFSNVAHQSSRNSQVSEYKKYSNPGWFDNVVPTLFECTELEEDQFAEAWVESLILKAKAVGYLIKYGPKIEEFFGGEQQDVDNACNVDISLHALSTYSKSFLHQFNVTCTATAQSCEDRLGNVDDSAQMIRVCPAFFELGKYGYNSQAGTLVKLETQFNDVGGTFPRGIAPEEVKELAKQNPTLSLTTAESYQYFAESIKYDLE